MKLRDDFRKTWLLLKSRVFPLSLPLIIENGLITSMGLINAAMATNLGREVASAIGVVDSLSVMLISLAQAMSLGGTVVVAQHTGRRDPQAANRAVTQSILAGLIVGVVLAVLFSIFRRPTIGFLFQGLEPLVQANAETYLGITALGYPFLVIGMVASGVLRGAGDARLPMVVNVFTNILNAAAGRILMYGIGDWPGLGIVGAAWAITAARAAGGLAFLYFLVSGRRPAKLPDIRRIRYDSAVLKTVLAVGIPASIESLMFNGGKLITQMYSVRLGTLAITVNYIAMTLASFTQIPASALSMATTPIVGQAVGRGDHAQAKELLIAIVGLTTIVLSLCCLPMFFWSDFFIRLYTKDADILVEARRVIKFFCVAGPLFWSVSFIIPAGLRGGGDSRYAMVVSMISMWAVRVGSGYILGVVMGYGILGIWIAMFADWILRSAFFALRLRGGTWIRAVSGG